MTFLKDGPHQRCRLGTQTEKAVVKMRRKIGRCILKTEYSLSIRIPRTKFSSSNCQHCIIYPIKRHCQCLYCASATYLITTGPSTTAPKRGFAKHIGHINKDEPCVLLGDIYLSMFITSVLDYCPGFAAQ